LGEIEDRSSRVGGDGGRLATSMKSKAAVVTCQEKEREKEKMKKLTRVLSMN
jgi:hypothetical protein